MNLIKKIIHNYKKRPKKTAVKYFKNGSVYQMNWEQTHNKIEQIYNMLSQFDIKPGDPIGIVANTCKEWGFIDPAIMAHQAVTVPIYQSSHIDEVEAILNEINPSVIFIQNLEFYDKFKKSSAFQKIAHKIMIDKFETSDSNCLFLEDLLAETVQKDSLADAAKKMSDSDLATIIYTSGTSGTPKGVMLNHEQIISSSSDLFPLIGITANDCSLTFLPFSHVLGRMELWGHYYCGYTIGYAESIERIKYNLSIIKPTVLVGVPRIFEKIYFGLKSQIEISKIKQSIFRKAISIGQENFKLKKTNQVPSLLQAIQSQLAYQLVFSQIHTKMGGRLRFAISGGAPLDPSIAELFSACGIPILEGYGLTETTAPIFINTLFENKIGSVGKSIGDVEYRFDDDQEILIKSKKVMQGYYKKPTATKDVFTEDGFFRTGDIGQIDKNGFLTITDRKKDLIKTAGGKFIAPQKLQNLFATHPLIGHVHVHGDKKKYIVALITLENSEAIRLQDQKSIVTDDYTELIQSQSLQHEVRKIVAEINSRLSSFETIKRFFVLDHEFSIDGGQLTPSLKMKRKKIDTLYRQQIESLYT